MNKSFIMYRISVVMIKPKTEDHVSKIDNMINLNEVMTLICNC